MDCKQKFECFKYAKRSENTILIWNKNNTPMTQQLLRTVTYR